MAATWRLRRPSVRDLKGVSLMTEDTDESAGVLTLEEAREAMEQHTRKYLDMSLDAFLEAAERGELPDRPIVRHLLMLAGVRPPAC